MPIIHEPLLTLKDAAAHAGVCRNTLSKYIKSGDLLCVVFSPRLKRIRIEDLERFIAAKLAGTTRSQDLSAALTEKVKVVDLVQAG